MKLLYSSLGLLLLILFLNASASLAQAPNPTINSLQTLIDDMTLPHEGLPHGVPAEYDWSAAPRIGMGNDPGEFRSLIAWGQVYEAAEGNPARNTRVEIRDIQTYLLSNTDGQWHRVQFAITVEGAAYVEDFVDNLSRPADLRYERYGSVSVLAGDGYNFHFWHPGRLAIDPADIGGIFTTVQARLILDDPTGPDDRAQARYVLSMGADYWQDASAEWDNFATNADVAIGRFRYVTGEWQAFNMHTLSPQALRATPPPLD